MWQKVLHAVISHGCTNALAAVLLNVATVHTDWRAYLLIQCDTQQICSDTTYKYQVARA